MKLYIAGKMSGLPQMGYSSFFEAEDNLQASGYETINPASIGVIPDWKWEDYMRYALGMMMEADGVAVLNNWKDSKGARLEVLIAKELNMPVMTVGYWTSNGYKPYYKKV